MRSAIFISAISLLPAAFAAPLDITTRGCVGPDVNSATIALVKEFEGFVDSPAPDPVGLPTVGYGHLCQTKNCGEVSFSFPLTEDSATKLLLQDIKSPQQTITLKTADGVHLNENQYGALVSWTFNVGPGNVATSSLLKRLNALEDVNTVLREELPKWKYGGGKVLPGLARRRAAEVALGETATEVGALPVDC
ncbi:glycoside hydrolase family 24 protein [Arthroderma uncinatum]|uniref:glycoside hydrolase family 24 protein n=1 Tax=Arthroderma uncinatum TaxID=74035 RepID=UPI00144A7FA8|nr:glycoside hydrolase family 24 protein [Arthroderma uncinatum]KAF3482256.1 glycoside hydrolase family 24 protein [Arthroderma uncinatum]